MLRNKGSQGIHIYYAIRHSCRSPSYIQRKKRKEIALWKKQPCKVHCRTMFLKPAATEAWYVQKWKRVSKGMCYHCVSLVTSNSCIHNGHWEPVQTGQQTKALNSTTSRTTGPWQLLWPKKAIVTEKKSILHSHQKLHYKAFSTWCNDLLTAVEQTWTCTAKAACPRHRRPWPKKLQNHHGDQLRLKELTKGFKKRQYNKLWRNTSQN